MTGTVRRIFKGPAGLRTGWAIAIFLVVVSVVGGIIGFVERWAIKHFDPAYWGRIATVMHGAAHAPVAFVLTNEVPLLLSYMAALAVMLWIEHKRFTAFGLGGVQRWQRLVAGFVAGFGGLSLLILLLWSTGHLIFLAHPVHPGPTSTLCPSRA